MTLSPWEFALAMLCIVGGGWLQWRSRKTGAVDMQILGIMLWVAGLILAFDSHWHFWTEGEH